MQTGNHATGVIIFDIYPGGGGRLAQRVWRRGGQVAPRHSVDSHSQHSTGSVSQAAATNYQTVTYDGKSIAHTVFSFSSLHRTYSVIYIYIYRVYMIFMNAGKLFFYSILTHG